MQPLDPTSPRTHVTRFKEVKDNIGTLEFFLIRYNNPPICFVLKNEKVLSWCSAALRDHGGLLTACDAEAWGQDWPQGTEGGHSTWRERVS
jgi:hypothetical protein